MSSVLQIQDRLRENTAMIAQVEKALTQSHSKALAASLRSLYKLNHVYEQEFRAAASADMVDVVSYRLFDSDHPTISVLGKALDYFQHLYAVVYSAVVAGQPKSTAHLTPDAATQTAFEFAYTYSGSVGFVFTLPTQLVLFGESQMDIAMNALFEIAKSDGTEAIKAHAKRYGVSTVRAIHKWASVLVSAGMGADIAWRRDAEVKNTLLLQPAELAALKTWIDLTSDVITSNIALAGLMTRFDSTTRSFKFDPDVENEIVRGVAAKDSKLPSPVGIPKRYTAHIRRLTKINYATDQPEVENYLVGLDEIAEDKGPIT